MILESGLVGVLTVGDVLSGTGDAYATFKNQLQGILRSAKTACTTYDGSCLTGLCTAFETLVIPDASVGESAGNTSARIEKAPVS